MREGKREKGREGRREKGREGRREKGREGRNERKRGKEGGSAPLPWKCLYLHAPWKQVVFLSFCHGNSAQGYAKLNEKPLKDTFASLCI